MYNKIAKLKLILTNKIFKIKCKKTKEDAMFCANCGKEIPEDSNICPYCGAVVSSQPNYVETPPSQEGIQQQS